MIGRLAVRSLTAHPVRSAVLAAGFGLGVAVMAILLGIAEIVLEQSRSPDLVGGGDVVLRLEREVPARLVLTGTLQSDALLPRIRTVSPSHTSTLYLVGRGTAVSVEARGGIPSLERALGDRETASAPAWTDSAEDVAWTQDTPEKVLRYIDRFHPIPDVQAWAGSWAEWLYFNGAGADARFYLTFLVGPARADGRRDAGVRLQLDRGGTVETFSQSSPIADIAALRAPDLSIGASSVRLEGMRYHLRLDLRDARGRRVRGDLTLDASPGKLVPPLEITGARGWRSGYVVPVMAGALNGTLDVEGDAVSFAGGRGYHDHNWGFWKGVSWQWGQVQHDGLSLIYGRVFPPPEAADPNRVPGFIGVLGPEGPLGYAMNVTISETNDDRGRPQTITVRGSGRNLNINLRFDVQSAVINRAAVSGPLSSGLDFLQLRGTYTASGRAGDRSLNFSAPGSAETFRGK
jgi:hypothetical protein